MKRIYLDIDCGEECCKLCRFLDMEKKAYCEIFEQHLHFQNDPNKRDGFLRCPACLKAETAGK